MNTETGEIRELKDISEEEMLSGKWAELDAKQAALFEQLTRQERLVAYRKNTKPHRRAVALGTRVID